MWHGREFALEQAGELFELLGDDATRELEQRMENPDNDGQAKVLAMKAKASGIDPSDTHAINTFTKSRKFPHLEPVSV